MAAGDILLDASGNRILDADGNVRLSDGVGDACCCDEDNNYIQAKLCEDDSDADLWFVYNDDGTINTTDGPNTALPYHFELLGEHYYVNEDCNISATPGTLASGYTTTEYCPGDCDSNCVADGPKTVSVTLSGVTFCSCVLATSIGYASFSGSLNGTYDLEEASACCWNGTFTVSVTATIYTDSTCTAVNCTRSFNELRLRLTRGSASSLALAGILFGTNCANGPQAVQLRAMSTSSANDCDATSNLSSSGASCGTAESSFTDCPASLVGLRSIVTSAGSATVSPAA